MDIIRNYLENMFANLPNSPEVRRAKDELGQMMEDKYNELISEGKSENEAVGCVISEFGNLDELAQELGLEKEVSEEKKLLEESPRRQVSFEEIKEFLHDASRQAFGVSTGVALCILSVCWPIITDSTKLIPDSLGVLPMFVTIAVAVVFFIVSSNMISRWSFLRKELCSIDYSTAIYVQQEKERFRASYMVQLSVGILLCATSWMPVAFFGEATPLGIRALGSVMETMSVVFLFVLCAIGVFLIIHSSKINGSYEEVLKLNNRNTVGGNFVEDDEEHYAGPVADSLMSIYWPTIRAFYLIWSFLTFAWYRTWIIWPVAAILHAILSALLRKSTQYNTENEGQ